MEESFQKGQANLSSGKVFEYKELVEESQLKIILKAWINALEQNTDLDVTINGKECHVPKEAFKFVKTKAEYELKNGQYEFELELKWRDSDLKLS